MESSTRLGGEVGRLLRQERELRWLTQRDLAIATGIAQTTVARVESGHRGAALPLVERLFAALGRQLVVGVEDLGEDVDRQIAQLADRRIDDRLLDTGVERFRRHVDGISYVFDGPTAALLQGAPGPAPGVHVALLWSEADPITEWLTGRYASRWMDRWQEYRHIPVDPREPYPHRWQTIAGEIHARMCDELPESIDVRHGERHYPVVPLAELAIADPGVARLLDRHRVSRSGQPAPGRSG
ncbi:helix-turn-helix domain-containing protein [Micromonospora sp. LOL_021]|uniref:helix-turn-helix domain-containing protein n=1 Tax=Micromonospora sp. LOL_021 TaxID=3345417 RepID=UPI003A89E2E7